VSQINGVPREDAIEEGKEQAHRPDNVIAVMSTRSNGTVWQAREFLNHFHQGKVLPGQSLIGLLRLKVQVDSVEGVEVALNIAVAGVHLPLVRIQSVLGAIVSPGVKVTASAGLHPVTANLHVPEQGFPKLHGSLTVCDEIIEMRGQWDATVLSHSQMQRFQALQPCVRGRLNPLGLRQSVCGPLQGASKHTAEQ
jgi:hypothetical protein